MSHAHLIRLSLRWAVTFLFWGLLVSGCRLVEKPTLGRGVGAGTAQVLSTNPVPAVVDDDHLLVKGTLNSHSVQLLLDTGASHTVLPPTVAATVGIQKAGSLRVNAFGNGRSTAKWGFVDRVAVGPAVAEKLAAVILPVPSVLQCDGLLGLSFLREFTFRLDYEQMLVSFAAPADTNLARSSSSLALTEEENMLTVQAEVDGVPAKLVVDTGGGQSLILKSWFVEEHQLRARHPERLSVATGVSLLGTMHGEIVRLQSLRLGDYTLTNAFAEFEPATSSTRQGDIAGFLGGPILSRFNSTFDVAGKRLWIEPNSSYPNRFLPPGPARSGMAVLPPGQDWIVLDVLQNSPAAEAGVRRGDRLRELDGVPLSSLKPDVVKHAFRAEPGTQIKLRLQTGKKPPREVTLTLRDLL